MFEYRFSDINVENLAEPVIDKSGHKTELFAKLTGIAILELTDKQFEVYVLIYIHHKTIGDTANVLKKKYYTIKWMLEQIKNKLRKHINNNRKYTP